MTKQPEGTHHVLRLRPWVMLATGTIGAVGALAGCSSAFMGTPPCMPPSYSVTPATAGIGDTVTVEAPNSDCNPRYSNNAEIQVTVADSNGTTILDTTAPMEDAGSFAYSFEIPADAESGEGTVEAYPYDVDWCDDTGRNSRVSGGGTSIVRASCAARIEMLTITN